MAKNYYELTYLRKKLIKNIGRIEKNQNSAMKGLKKMEIKRLELIRNLSDVENLLSKRINL